MTGPAPTVGEVADLLAELRTLSGRLARFEPVTADELGAYHARKVELFDRIDGGPL